MNGAITGEQGKGESPLPCTLDRERMEGLVNTVLQRDVPARSPTHRPYIHPS